MKLSKEAEAALAHWLATDWHTKHGADMDRWYRFVDQYQRDHGFEIDEAALRETIESKIGSVTDELQDVIRERVSLAYNILDFLKCTGR